MCFCYTNNMWSIKANTCKLCKLQYTGQTVCRLSDRITGHRGHISDGSFSENSDEATLAEHLSVALGLAPLSEEVFNASYSFTVVELGSKDMNEAERRWANKLVTLKPFGLNKLHPGGAAASMSM